MYAKGWTIDEKRVQKADPQLWPMCKLDPQRCHADRCLLELSIKLTMTSSTCRCTNDQSASQIVAVMGCQSSCNWGVQHMQLYGQAASISIM